MALTRGRLALTRFASLTPPPRPILGEGVPRQTGDASAGCGALPRLPRPPSPLPRRGEGTGGEGRSLSSALIGLGLNLVQVGEDAVEVAGVLDVLEHGLEEGGVHRLRHQVRGVEADGL